MIEPATWPPDEVAALLDDDEDAPRPVDSVVVVYGCDVDDPRVLRAAIWSCY